MPDLSTVNRWLAKDEVFRAQYARAREDQTDAFGEQLIEIADDPANTDRNQLAHASLRIETRKWVMARMAPKKWGVASRGDGGGDNESGPPDIGNVPPGVPI